MEKTGEMLSGAKESETDYGTLYTPEYKEKYLSGVTYEITARENIVTPEGTVWFHKGDYNGGWCNNFSFTSIR